MQVYYNMTIAYKDIVGGGWKVYQHPARDLFSKRKTTFDQLKELQGLGNVIIGTCRGNKIRPRFVRRY